jgi:diguanylate cyclase (GGDEF)-like protein
VTNDFIISTAADELPRCPVGEPQCGIIDQLGVIRHENAVLSEQVRTDTLTGLYNFHHFMQALSLEMERTRRTGQPTALIMVDLDHFKQVNDTWGHEAGNQALVSAADVLRQTTRRLDIPCRYGGEEFAVILPSVDLIVSIQVAERIRAQVEVTPVNVNGAEIKLTGSFGIALYEGSQDDTPEGFVERADHCLYQAKESGRNRVCHEIKELEDAHLAVTEEEKDALFSIFSDDK